MSVGFHTRADLKKSNRRGTSRGAIPTETIERMGSRAVANMNPKAKNPNLQPTGPADAELYVLGNWPSEAEDKIGKAWGHSEARPVRKLVGRVRVRYGHTVRTLPKTDKPLEHEVLAFRKEVLADIEATRPKVILCCGNLAFQILQPGLAPSMKSNMHIHRGRKFPVRVGRHTCWMVPTFSMDEYAVMVVKGDKVCRDGRQWQRFLDDDIRVALELSKSQGKPPFVEVHDAGRILEQADAQLLYKPDEILDALDDLIVNVPDDPLMCHDYETQGTRPYQKGARVDTLAIKTARVCISFPVQHPRITWSPEQWAEFLVLWGRVLALYEDIAHGQEFETEWDMHLLGRKAARLPKRRHCSIVQAFVLSSRAGRVKNEDDKKAGGSVAGLSLDYVCRLWRGLPLKALSAAKLWEERDALPDLLKYGALDVILTFEVFLDQDAELEAEGLLDIYYRQMRRIPTVVLSQWDGVPCEQDGVEDLREQYQARLDEADAELRSLDEIKEFDRRFGRRFNPGAPEDAKQLFNVVLEQELLSSTEAAIAKFVDVEFSAKYILAWRKAKKMLSTYVSPFLVSGGKHHIQPDGLIHCRYYTTRTQTGRVSSAEPNMTNLPERGAGKDCKRPMIAPPGWEWSAFDYKSIEARVFAIVTGDKAFTKALWKNYDVHMEWAQKIAGLFPDVLRRHDGEIKQLRSAIKNQLVFPWFFGAGLPSVAKSLGVDEDQLKPVREEFRLTFKGIFAWHKQISKFFDQNGYVETLTGRRRHGPMSFNAQTNMPIQGLAADICFDAWDRISEHALRENIPYLNPRMMVHDDLKFLHPISERDHVMEVVPRMMCQLPFSWARVVPIEVEASRGPNLFDMTECGEFSSEDYAA